MNINTQEILEIVIEILEVIAKHMGNNGGGK